MTEQQKKLGFKEGLASTIGLVIAASGMLTMSQGFGMGGYVFVIAVLIAWFLMMCQATSFAELSGFLPTAGAVYDYIACSMGRFWAMTVTISAYIVVQMFAAPAEAAAAGVFAQTNFSFLNGIAPHNTWMISWFIIIICTIINLIGVDLYGKAETVLSFIKWSTLAVIGAIGLLLPHKVQIDGLFGPSLMGDGLQSVLSLIGFALFLFVGAEYVTPLAPEMKNPAKNIPRSLFVGLVMVLVALFLYGVGMLYQVPNVVVNEKTGTRLFETAASIPAFGYATLANFGKWWLAIAVFAATLAVLNAVIAGVSRILYGMAKDGMLPKIFAYLHPKYKTPWAGIFFIAAIPMIGSYIIQGNIDGIFTLLLSAICSWIFCYVMINIAVIILRRRRPDLHRPYKVPFYPVPQILAIIGLLVALWFIAPPFLDRASIYIPFVIMIAVCAIFSLVWTKLVQKINPWKAVEPEEILNSIKQDEHP
jgi:amino acid transporter